VLPALRVVGMISSDDLTAAHGWLQSLRPLPPDVTEELRHRFEVALTHHSTAIEGNTLTQSETQIVIEKGITIGGKSVAEHLEIIGHKEALDFIVELADKSVDITEREIREIHNLVMKDLGNGDSGRYRSLDVKAAGTDYVYSSYLKVPELMTDFVTWLNEPSSLHPVEFATEAHLRFVTIHPFRDGNGRVGRLILNLMLLRFGYPIAVLNVRQRAEYIASLEAAQTGGTRKALDILVRQAVASSFRETLTTALSSASVTISDESNNNIKDWLGSRDW
jgi:Fic family protein